MKNWGWIVTVVVVALLAIWFWPSTAGMGTLRLQITDAPSSLNISGALITISGIEVHMAGADENATAGNQTNATNSTTTAGWYTVVPGPANYDLINITDVKQFLGSKELQAGKYTQVRLNIDSAIVTIGGTEYNLTVPSDKIRLVHEFDIVAGQTTTLTLDFDANESVIKQGNNVYRLQPTIRIISEE